MRDRIEMILNDVGQRILFDLALDEISLVSLVRESFLLRVTRCKKSVRMRVNISFFLFSLKE